MANKFNYILKELRNHSPFTLMGSLLGVLFMLIFRNISDETSYVLFYIFHPGHIILSAMVTTALFRLYSKKRVPQKKIP